MNRELKYNFIIHLCKYLGIGLLSGSIVHAGTLGGNNIKYIVLISFGILLTVVGNYLEYKLKNIKVGSKLLFLTIGLAFGTGMLSGSIQHYLDNPMYGAVLFSIGLVLAFVTLAYKDYYNEKHIKSIIFILVISFISYVILANIIPKFIPQSFLSKHNHSNKYEHSETNIIKNNPSIINPPTQNHSDENPINHNHIHDKPHQK